MKNLVSIFLGIATIVTFGYTLPMLVAHVREHKDAAAITILNLLLGWTFIGWVIALIWVVKK